MRATTSRPLFTVLLFCFSLVSGINTRSNGCQLPIRRVPHIRPLAPSTHVLSTDISISNRHEFAYLISITVAGQSFSVIFDTGSSDFWIVSSDCTTSDCNGVKKYNETQSFSLSLSANTFKLSYLMGAVTGNIAFDTVSFGRFAISSQVFALANETIGLGLSSTGHSGILGFSFPSIAAISLSYGDTLLGNIMASLDEPSRFFAFQLGRTSGSNDGGSFTIGQLDPVITNDFTKFSFTPVSRAGADMFNYWKLPLRYLTMGSAVFALSSSLVPEAEAPIAVLDTGTTLVLGPSADVNAFWQAVSHEGATRKNKRTGMWEVRCDLGIAMGFVLGEAGGEREYPVDPEDINWAEGGSVDGWCMGGIQVNDRVNSGDWLLGDVFLRNVYVTHHYANSTHSPIIGLLTMTDASASMTRFQQNRGLNQSTPSTLWRRHSVPRISPPHTSAMCALSSVSGFVGGAIFTAVARMRRNRSVG